MSEVVASSSVINGPSEQPNSWPASSGEMATQVRDYHWFTTAFYKSESWPQSLRTAEDLTLACQFAMIVLWGSNLIKIYNDVYRDLMEASHPLRPLAPLGFPTAFSRSANFSGAFSPHCHTVSTSHPIFSSSSPVRASRATLTSKFEFQNSTRVLGELA